MNEVGNYPHESIYLNAVRMPTVRATSVAFLAFMGAAVLNDKHPDILKSLAVGFAPVAVVAIEQQIRMKSIQKMTGSKPLYFDPHPDNEKSDPLALKDFKQHYRAKTLTWGAQNGMISIMYMAALSPQYRPLAFTCLATQLLTDAGVRIARDHKVRTGQWVVTHQPPPANYV